MTQELKPCPFCGGTDVSVCDSTTTRTAKCRSCVVYIAIEKWNSRPIEDALRAEVARLRAELDVVRKYAWKEDAGGFDTTTTTAPSVSVEHGGE